MIVSPPDVVQGRFKRRACSRAKSTWLRFAGSPFAPQKDECACHADAVESRDKTPSFSEVVGSDSFRRLPHRRIRHVRSSAAHATARIESTLTFRGAEGDTAWHLVFLQQSRERRQPKLLDPEQIG